MANVPLSVVSPSLAHLLFPTCLPSQKDLEIWQKLQVGLKVKGHNFPFQLGEGWNYSILLSLPEEVLNYLFLSLRFKRG